MVSNRHNMSRNPALRILIINVHSSRNAGDLALLEAVIAQARAVFAQPQITVSANWPDEQTFQRADYAVVPSPWYSIGTTKRAPVPLQMVRLALGWLLAMRQAAFPSARAGAAWQALFQSYQNADVVIGVSGNQFYSTGKYGWPFPVNVFSVELAHIFHKPFYTMPQSIGPLKRGWERHMLRAAYGRAKKLFFRERISLRLAHAIGLPDERCHYAPDPAFAAPSARPEEALAVLGRYGFQQGALHLGATIIAPMGRSLDAAQVEQYYTALAELFQALQETFGITIYLFNQVTGPTAQEDDRGAVRTVLERMSSCREHVVFVNETLSPRLLKACYGQMDFFLASRLHSGIFALGMGVPTLFINYLTKTRGVLEALGLGDWSLDLAGITGERLQDVIFAAWGERHNRAAILSHILPEVVAASQHTMQEIANDADQY